MILVGIAQSEATSRTDERGRRYFAFGVLERHQTPSGSWTARHEVHAYVDELSADLVTPGLASFVRGYPRVRPYVTSDGRAAAEVTIVADVVEPCELQTEMLPTSSDY